MEKNNSALQARIDSFSRKNDSINIVLKENNKQIDQLFLQGTEMLNSLEENADKIIKLKKEYEKTNRIDSFKSADIVRYFTENLN